MSTSLVKGLNLQQAIEAVRQAAVDQLKPGVEVGFWTEVGRTSVLVGLAKPGWSCTMTIPVEQYDGRDLLKMVLAQ